MLNMELYSTRNRNERVSLEEAVMRGLPPDNGLYMPAAIPRLPVDFWDTLEGLSFPELSFRMSRSLLGESLPEQELESIIHGAISFPAPLLSLTSDLHVLELFHGPSLAFKDFGARFMARLMSYFNRNADRELTILVATSGDTGGAVAAGFFETPGIRVVILFPSGKVSPLQEKQLTTWGGNIFPLEVKGNFDDCQQMVKQAFLDAELKQRLRLSSANSINIARLIPQSFYYVEGWKQIKRKEKATTFVVPSGNFGNLTAGILAQRMGLPARHFVAATNANKIVPDYLETQIFEPKASIPTLSNAMDVGNPSNFVRLLDLYGSTWNMMQRNITGFHFSDEETLQAIGASMEKFGYLPCPHTAVGLMAATKFRTIKPDEQTVVLATAHPAKFIPVIEKAIGHPPDIPETLDQLQHREGNAQKIEARFSELKAFLHTWP
jgi:threonine synthase